MRKKFRGGSYLTSIKKEKNRAFVDPDVYIYPESNYTIEWEIFFSISNFPENEKNKFKENFVENFILSNRSAIAEMAGNKVDSLKYVNISYTELTFLKRKLPECYNNFLTAYQKILLQNKYPLYSLVSEKKRREFEIQLYNMTNDAVAELDNFLK